MRSTTNSQPHKADQPSRANREPSVASCCRRSHSFCATSDLSSRKLKAATCDSDTQLVSTKLRRSARHAAAGLIGGAER
eukprot:scaffold17768_cov31-Tisochrysis_lutea.AAC.3